MKMGWTLLVIAGLFEIVWAVGLKFTDGFTKLWPSVITISAILVSLGCLSYALKTIPMGNAYAIWTGIGVVGVAIVGIICFDEIADPRRIACIGLIVVGILGLRFMGSGSSLV